MNTAISSGTAPVDSLLEVTPAFFPARLMTPTEVAAAVSDGPAEVRSRTQGKWHLCGDVSERTFAILSEAHRSETPMRISAFRTPTGAPYGIVSHQVRGLAHRFLLPLYEACVIELLTELRNGGELGFLLGRNGNREALLVEPPQGSLSGFAPLLAMSGSVGREQVGQVILELSRVVEAIANPAQIPTLRTGEAVLGVDVSAVMPIATLRSFLFAPGDPA